MIMESVLNKMGSEDRTRLLDKVIERKDQMSPYHRRTARLYGITCINELNA